MRWTHLGPAHDGSASPGRTNPAVRTWLAKGASRTAAAAVTPGSRRTDSTKASVHAAVLKWFSRSPLPTAGLVVGVNLTTTRSFGSNRKGCDVRHRTVCSSRRWPLRARGEANGSSPDASIGPAPRRERLQRRTSPAYVESNPLGGGSSFARSPHRIWALILVSGQRIRAGTLIVMDSSAP
jgi:hypothetical protein